MNVLDSLDEYDRCFHPEVIIDGNVLYRGKSNGIKPQDRAHNRARELDHGFYIAYNSYFKECDSYAFGSFKDYDHYEAFFNKYAKGNLKACRFFEQMVGKSKLYLDVDVSPYPTGYTGEELLDQIHHSVDRSYFDVFGRHICKDDWRITDSTKPAEKMSYHMTLCNSGRFLDAHTHMFSFFHVVMQDFEKNAPPCMTDYGKSCPIDKGVYTINRNFRLVNNVKHKNVNRPLLQLEGQDFPYKDYAATACDSEEDLSEEKVYEHAMKLFGQTLGKLTSRTHLSKRKPAQITREAKAAKGAHNQNSVAMDFMHGKNRDATSLILFEHDKIDIESMKSETGGCFKNCSMVSSFLGHSVKQIEYARPFIVGYSFNYDRTLPCLMCGGDHQNNHVWVMYDSHLNRYMKQHSKNCIERPTLIPFTHRGLCLWQNHYERKVWRKPTAQERACISELLTVVMRCRHDLIGPIWVTGTGVAITSEHKNASEINSHIPKTYYFFQMDDQCPPHVLHRSQRPWSFSDRTKTCIIRDDAFDLFYKKCLKS